MRAGSRTESIHTADRAPRDFGADMVRIGGLILLLWLHFYLRNGFYYQKINGFSGFAAVVFRPVFMCCVPLFMMLTGYLKCGKKWSKGYYRSLLPILISYALIALIHLFYKIFWLEQSMTAGEWILSFFRFEMANYGWYVGMYIGLFLLSPLLNMIWNSCETKRMHQMVVLTFVALTFLPSTVNDTPIGNLIPNYFQAVYYVTYYIIGCYIRTYRPKPKTFLCILFILAMGALMAWINISTRTEPGSYYSGYRVGYNGLVTGSMTTAVFLLFYRLKTESGKLRKAAAHLSGIVLEMYLLSHIADSNIYTMFYKKYPMSLYLPVGIVMTLAVFIVTYPAAFCVNRISGKLAKLLMGEKAQKTTQKTVTRVPKEGRDH